MVANALKIQLPTIAELEQRAKALAMLDCILSPDNAYRYYTFDARWADGERMAKLDTGGGDTVYLMFAAQGAFVLGFDHESAMSPAATEDGKVWPGVLDSVPAVFQTMVDEPAFESNDYTTFCLWRETADGAWRCGEIAYPDGDVNADGSGYLLGLYCGESSDFVEWAAGYHEVDVPEEAVARVFALEPLSEALVRLVSAAADWDAVKAEALDMGYPLA